MVDSSFSFPYLYDFKIFDDYDFVNKRILNLIRKIENGDFKDDDIVDFGVVDDKTADIIKEITGINVRGFKIVLEARQLKHTIKEHGKNGKTDHSLANETDIAKMFYAMQTANEMRYGGTTNAYVEFRKGHNRSAKLCFTSVHSAINRIML